ncbi:MAG: hypothetical protein ACRCWS_04715 [Propionibacteriaceae bacterium]
MKTATKVLGLATATFLAPLVIGQHGSGTPDRELPTIEAAVAQCRNSGLVGKELVDYAAQLVREHFLVYSIRAPWMTTGLAWAQRRGNAAQYNGCLSEILSELGFAQELVFAARVRTDKENPWWWMNHVWVRVMVEGRNRDICARYSTELGSIDFVPVTEVLPWRVQTRITTTAAACVGSAYQQWVCLTDGDPMPEWVEGPFAR